MNNDMQKMINALSGKLGLDSNTVNDAVNSGKADKLISALGPKEAEKLNRILSDKAETQRILQSEQVQKLIKKLSEGK